MISLHLLSAMNGIFHQCKLKNHTSYVDNKLVQRWNIKIFDIGKSLRQCLVEPRKEVSLFIQKKLNYKMVD